MIKTSEPRQPMFKDYVSTFEEFKRLVNSTPRAIKAAQQLGVDSSDFESVYKAEMVRLDPKTQMLAVERLKSELEWYRVKRPFFNVYPLIENKFLELDTEIDMSELVMPFPTIEVRTKRKTILLCEKKNCFLVIIERRDGVAGEYQELVIQRTSKISRVLDAGFAKIEEPWIKKGNAFSSEQEMRECLFIAVGTCMLARDRQVVMPVILNKDRKDSMTPAEIAAYADKATKRTGRIGFEVGKEIERMQATVHYRNGCFAKYYVGKTHESYPPNAEASKVPIIKWRCGSVVGKENVPKVPTGFKDLVAAPMTEPRKETE